MSISQLTLFILLTLLAFIIFELWKVLRETKKIQHELDEKLSQLNRTIQILTTRLDPKDDDELYMNQLDDEYVDRALLPDPLYNDAIKIVMKERKASASLIQRRLSIGYARAARIIDKLELDGYIGPQEGIQQRKVLK
jgi:DNA segregation ATPase FtsK/SpoIIIE-like protein